MRNKAKAGRANFGVIKRLSLLVFLSPRTTANKGCIEAGPGTMENGLALSWSALQSQLGQRSSQKWMETATGQQIVFWRQWGMNVKSTSISLSILKLTLIPSWVMGERLHGGALVGIWVWPACVGSSGEMEDMRPFPARWFPSLSLSFETLAFPVVLGDLDHDMKKSLSLGLLGRQIFTLCWTIGLHSFIHSEMFIEQVCVQRCTDCCPYIPPQRTSVPEETQTNDQADKHHDREPWEWGDTEEIEELITKRIPDWCVPVGKEMEGVSSRQWQKHDPVSEGRREDGVWQGQHLRCKIRQLTAGNQGAVKTASGNLHLFLRWHRYRQGSGMAWPGLCLRMISLVSVGHTWGPRKPGGGET